MNRKYFRLVCTVALLLALSFAVLPTAEARTLAGSRTAITGTHDLWSTALAWMTSLLPGATAGRPLGHLSSASTTGGTGTGGGYTTNTGPCIDPLGVNRCQSTQ
jgi:hypothetical protein